MDLSLPAADLLGRNRARILGSLAAVSDGLTGRRISELAGVPASTGQRILAEFEDIGLVSSSRAGAAYLYRLNRSHVLWEPVEAMLDIPARVDTLIADLAGDVLHEGTSLSIYGSAARGEAHRNSDADLVVVWGEDDIDREAALAALSDRVTELTGNEAEIIDLTRDALRDLVGSADPLVSSWRRDARTLRGPSLKRLIGSAS